MLLIFVAFAHIVCVIVLSFMVMNYSSEKSYILNTSPLNYSHQNITITGFNLTGLNYENECGDIFKYPKATERDVILFSYGHSRKWKRNKKSMRFAFSLVRKVLPKVTLVMLTVGKVPPDFIQLMNEFNVTIVPSPKQFLKGWNCVNARIPLSLEYLKQHKNDIDRVAWSDTRDVFYFNDIFATVGMNDLVWMSECVSPTDCFRHSTTGQKLHFYWMWWFYGRDEALKLTQYNTPTLNGGFGIGGVSRMIQLLTKLTQEMDPKFTFQWGYDQTLLNYLYYKGELIDIGLGVDRCTQRMCFANKLNIIGYGKHTTFSMKGSSCAPVLLHKGLPSRLMEMTITYR
ncbi:hypothetical protein EDI_141470 [Entamoeba dispar SAW760]|uniref:Uncharacterized protein n=1 Tax=Entamoeba dispar (strain ATCC PRA-260 / SAW760) TaxID=370354 RepID=B0EID8_ENTDS|nr:uncharacterized protein EDI_141470 [Entamoeba dispar SAW760]EDR25713.1 hypothetical protein EDI_141470 [Entamoeba dispar SAW760]|eukprot:EDR25713.1 hypothetical protein EDI_141470 [Entamoeba dispar SAW760]